MPKRGFRHSEDSKRRMSETKKKTLPSAEERFWSWVVASSKEECETECWLWVGDTYPDGYGRLWVSGRNVRVHKFSWMLHYGSVENGLWVLHKCDTPTCVRPDHLFLGTYRDNIDDMVQKGRSLIGEKHHNAKLTEEQVIEILQWKSGQGELLQEMAARMGVTTVAMGLIRAGINWKHLYHHHSKFAK